jgi:hypothetical protein
VLAWVRSTDRSKIEANPGQERIVVTAWLALTRPGRGSACLLDDIGGQLGRVAAADVAHRVDRPGRDEQDVAGVTVVVGWPSIWYSSDPSRT